jgi:hypothetical protein
MPGFITQVETDGFVKRTGKVVKFKPGSTIGGSYSASEGNSMLFKFGGAIASMGIQNNDVVVLAYDAWSPVADFEPVIPTGTGKVLGYVMQPDSQTCQSAAIARVLGTTDVMKVRAALTSMGAAGDPVVMGAYLKPLIKEYRYSGNASLDEAIAALKAGYQLITHGWFTGSGHVIGLSGYDGKNFNAEDPWAAFSFPSWSYDFNKSGDNQQYSALGIYASCVVGQSVSDSYRIYQGGKINLAAKGMYLHMCRN